MRTRLELTTEERLTLQQLLLLDWSEKRSHAEAALGPSAGQWKDGDLPPEWMLTKGLSLSAWQLDARQQWFDSNRRGTIKVVTGAGKTVAAMAITQQLQQLDRDLRVAIVVPTIVLMEQWLETFRNQSNLPYSAVGRIGGGHADMFDERRRVIIAVLASARKKLPAVVRKAEVGDHLLLIADECHRAGAPEMSAVLQTERAYSLGLSATPEREDLDENGDSAGDYASSQLGREIGPIVYEMTFAEATRIGLIPPFELQHYGLGLSEEEAQRYETLSRSIREARDELLAASPEARRARGGDRLAAWARQAASRPSGRFATLAARFVNDTSRRKQLLFRARSRTGAASNLVAQALAERPDARIILFHESIEEVESLFERLRRDGAPVVMEHSDLPGELRAYSVELFGKGAAKVIVSARSLIEGFNVPAADLGIVVASSSSSRQRIQSIGRVLRTHRDATGAEKVSRVCVLYIRDSVDELIYEKEDWDRLIGAERNRYFCWDPIDHPPIELPGPPRQAIPRESDIDIGSLVIGSEYPGRYEGDEYSVDSRGNICREDGRVAANPQNVPADVTQLKGSAGRFRVTPRHHAIIVRVPAGVGDDWTTLYGGRLSNTFDFGNDRGEDLNFDVGGLSTGDIYPGPIDDAVELRFRQRAGGVVAKRVPRGEAFARGETAEKLVAALRLASGGDRPISKFYMNGLGHTFWYEEGAPHFIACIDTPLVFPGEERQ